MERRSSLPDGHQRGDFRPCDPRDWPEGGAGRIQTAGCRKPARQEEILQNEPRDTDDRSDPNHGAPEEDAPERKLTLVNVIQQNAVIITGRKVKGGRPKQDKAKSKRWL